MGLNRKLIAGNIYTNLFLFCLEFLIRSSLSSWNIHKTSHQQLIKMRELATIHFDYKYSLSQPADMVCGGGRQGLSPDLPVHTRIPGVPRPWVGQSCPVWECKNQGVFCH